MTQVAVSAELAVPRPLFRPAAAPFTPDSKWKLHAICQEYRQMTDEEFGLLRADIAEHGLREPIVMYEGMVLDGQNRLRACIELGIEPKTTVYTGKNPRAYVKSKNLTRRHLSAGERAAKLVNSIDLDKAVKHGGDRKTDQVMQPSLDPETAVGTIAERAEAAGVGTDTIRKAEAVKKADPELSKRVAAGEVKLGDAVKQVLPKQAKSPKAAKAPAPDRLQGRIAELEGELAQAREDLQRMAEGSIERDERLAALQAFEGNEQVETITMLQRQLREAEIQRDTITRQSEVMRREIRRLHGIETKFIKLIKGGGATNEDLASITEERDHAVSNAADLAEQMEDVAAIRDGDDAKRLAVLRAELRGVKATRDTLIAEKSQLVHEVKRLNRKLGSAR